jgi:hypothetical protein
MISYNVLATKYGLNLNNEFITDEAIETFTKAFRAGHVSHFGHPYSNKVRPVIGKVLSTSIKDNAGHAVIEFNDDIAEQVDNGKEAQVSIYARCKSHFDDETGTRYIDELLYDDANAIDVVDVGAVIGAEVQERIENAKDDFVFCSVDFIEKQTNASNRISNEAANKSHDLGGKMAEFDNKEFAKEVAGIVCDNLATLAKEQAEIKAENSTLDAIKDAFMQGITVGANKLGETSIARIKNSITETVNIKQLVDDEVAFVESIRNEILDEVKNEADTPVVHKGNDVSDYSNDFSINGILMNAMKARESNNA